MVMDAKSIITSPAYPERLTEHGWRAVTGLAWTGRGRITRVDVSTDGGKSWSEAEIVGSNLPCAHVRFQHMWNWSGQRAQLMAIIHDDVRRVTAVRNPFVQGTK